MEGKVSFDFSFIIKSIFTNTRLLKCAQYPQNMPNYMKSMPRYALCLENLALISKTKEKGEYK